MWEDDAQEGIIVLANTRFQVVTEKLIASEIVSFGTNKRASYRSMRYKYKILLPDKFISLTNEHSNKPRLNN